MHATEASPVLAIKSHNSLCHVRRPVELDAALHMAVLVLTISQPKSERAVVSPTHKVSHLLPRCSLLQDLCSSRRQKP